MEDELELLQKKFLKDHVQTKAVANKTRDEILAESWTLNGPFVFFLGIVIILVLILTV